MCCVAPFSYSSRECRQVYSDRRRSVLPVGRKGGRKGQQRTSEGHGHTFPVLIGVMVSCVCTYVKTYQTVHSMFYFIF